MPLYGTKYIFSKQFFTGWVVVGIIWIFFTFIAVVIYPAWESRETLTRVLRLIFTGKHPKGVVHGGETLVVEGTSGSATPVRGNDAVSDEKA